MVRGVRTRLGASMAVVVSIVLGAAVVVASPEVAGAAGPTVLSGVVTDAATGLPIEGVSVAVVGGSSLAGTSVALGSETTNAAGVYTIDLTGLATAADAVTIDVVDPSDTYGVAYSNSVALVDDATTIASFALETGGVVAGAITGAGTGAVPGACVTIRNQATALVVPSGLAGTCSAADGGYRLPAVAPGTYTLSVATPDSDRWSSIPTRTVTVTAGSVATVDAELPAITVASSTTVTGTVDEAGTGAPLDGIALTARVVDAAGTSLTFDAVTAADGTFRIDLTGVAFGADPVVIDAVDPLGAHHPATGISLSLQAGYSEAIGITLLPVDLPATVDLEVAFPDFDPQFIVDEPRTIVATIANRGFTAAGATAVDIGIPAGFTIEGVDSPHGFVCSPNGSSVRCESASIGVGRVAAIGVRVLPVTPSFFGFVSMSTGIPANDTDPGDNFAGRGVIVSLRQAGIDAFVDLRELAAGTTEVIRFGADNNGPAAAEEVWTTLDLPPELTIERVESASATCAVEGQTVGCSAARLARDTRLDVDVYVRAADVASGLSLRVRAGSSTFDPTLLDNEFVGSFDVVPAGSVDLTVGGFASFGPVFAGQPTDLFVSVENRGPSAAIDTVVTAVLSEGLMLQSIASTPAGWTCGTELQTVTCTTASFERGGRSFQLIVVPQTVGSTVSADLAVSSASADIAPANDTNVVGPFPVIAATAALRISTSAPQMTVDQPAALVLAASNDGPFSAADVVMTAELPPELRIVGVTGDAGCTADGQVVTCASPSLRLFGSLTAVINVVPVAAFDGVMPVTLTSSTPDPDLSDNQRDVLLVSRPVAPDLQVFLSASGPMTVGTESTLFSAVSNNGTADARDVVLTFEMPAPLVITGIESSQYTCEFTDHLATCRAPQLARFSFSSVLLSVTPTEPTFGVVGTASGSSAVADANPSDDVATASYSVQPAVVDVSTAIGAVLQIAAGEPSGIPVAVSNFSSSSATDVVTVVTAESGVIESASPDPGSDWTCELTPEGAARCSIDRLAPFVTLAATVVVVAPDPAFNLVLTATSTTSTEDANPFNDSSTQIIDVLLPGSSDLGVFVDFSSLPVVDGRPVDIVAAVTNAGPLAPVTDVELVVDVPSTLAIRSVVGADEGWSCSTSDQTVTCRRDQLGSLASSAVSITVVPSAADVVVQVGARVAHAGPDQNPFNDAAATFANVRFDRADLAVSVFAADRTAVGEPVDVYVQVTNSRDVPATDVVAEIPVPAGFRYGGLQAASGWFCEPGPDSLRCEVPSLGGFGGATAFLTFTAEAAGPASLDASVSSATPDPFLENNRAVRPIEVYPAGTVDLVASVQSFSSVQVGEPASVFLSVTNIGPSGPAGDVVMTLTLPAELQLDESIPLPEGCVRSGSQLTCLAPSLGRGESHGFTVFATAVTPNPASVGSLVVSTSSPDPFSDNDTSTVTIDVYPDQADLSIALTASTLITVGQSGGVTAFVRNGGPARSGAFDVTIDLPAGMAVESFSASPFTSDCTQQERRLTCAFEDIGQSAFASLSATVRTDTPGLGQTVTASVAGLTDPDPANDAASATVDAWPVGGSDLLATASVQLAPDGRSGTVQWFVDNRGPALPATDVVFEAVLPPSLRITSVASLSEPWDCGFDGQQVRCSAVAFFNMDIITVSFETITAASGVVASGTVSSAGADLVPGNNTSATPPFDVSTLDVPLAPTEPVAAPRDRAVRLTWTPVPNPAPDIVDYVIEYSRDGGITWRRIDDGVSTATRVTITGLRNGVTYVLRVAGVNAAGTGAWSTVSDPVRPSRPPSAPTRVEARAGDRSVTVAWRAPSQHGRSPITDYVVQYSTDRGRTWVTVRDSVSTSTRTVVRGLTNGTRYVFRVAAVSAAGQSPFSQSSASVRPRAS